MDFPGEFFLIWKKYLGRLKYRTFEASWIHIRTIFGEMRIGNVIHILLIKCSKFISSHIHRSSYQTNSIRRGWKKTGSHKVQSLRKLVTGSNKWASRINYFKFSIWLPGNRRRWHDTIRSAILDAHCAAIKCVSITLFNPFSHISHDIS